jgi:FMN phosphatase YigB (HAD superfamily)
MITNRPKLLVFDFDGCLYPYPHNYMDIYNQARIHTGLAISGGTLDEQTSFDRCFESYQNHGFTFKSLCDDFKLSMGEGSLIHHRYVQFDLQRDEDLIDAFMTLDRQQVHLAIVTQGSRCNIDRHLPLIGLDRFFPRNLRITVDDHGYERLKSNSAYPWLLAKWNAESATGIKFEDEDIHAFEDSADNLKSAHSLGWNTHLMHHGKPLEKLPEYITDQRATAATFLRTLPQNPVFSAIAPRLS